ncbi:hypothetical protein Glove_9g228 [Diversispora epigaea]|uniref:Uncharacterized protein n=1 Tax=Diversispora epigaea TaxID=1348612 RepID=A0A397JRI2_9GLOM|nr:hypothetical protein Glove_9g228 [Diversispora epigaea]
MVIAKRRNDCVDEAIKQKNEALSEIIERELSREEKDPNYEVTYTLKDLNRIKDHLNLIKHHVWIRDNILVDNGRTVFNIPTRENQNPVTIRLPANFNLLNQQLAEAHFSASDSSDSSDTDTENEMANAVLDYLEDNLHNHTSLRVDPFYGDGTQDPLQWMLHFEKVARSNA